MPKPEPVLHLLHTRGRLCASLSGGSARRWALVTCPDCLEAIAEMERQQDLEAEQETRETVEQFQKWGL